MFFYVFWGVFGHFMVFLDKSMDRDLVKLCELAQELQLETQGLGASEKKTI